MGKFLSFWGAMYLLTETQLDIRRAAREFALGEFPDVGLDYDQREEFPIDLWKKACSLGFIGMFIDEEYGGGGFGLLETVLTIEEFSRVDPACTPILYAALGSEIIQTYGNPFQKEKYLRPITKGETILGVPCNREYLNFATISSLSARREREEYMINGEEPFVMSGSIANYLIITSLTNPEANLSQQKFSTIIIPATSSGVKPLEIKGKLGLRTLNLARVLLENVRVSKQNIIGGEGEGYCHLKFLYLRLSMLLAAQGLGIAQGALDMAVHYAETRKQFDYPIGHFQSTRLKIAEMMTYVESTRLLLYQAASNYDGGMENNKMALMARWLSSEVCEKVTEDALQLHGAYGFTKDYSIERFYRDAHVLGILNSTRERIKLEITESP